MTKQDIPFRIQAEIEAIKAEETILNFRYKHTHHSGMGTFDLLADIERKRKRRVELEDALRILEEFNKQ